MRQKNYYWMMIGIALSVVVLIIREGIMKA